MCLLLAPPGSGKSTLLKVLSGKIQNGGLLKASASSPFALLSGHPYSRGPCILRTGPARDAALALQTVLMSLAGE